MVRRTEWHVRHAMVPRIEPLKRDSIVTRNERQCSVQCARFGQHRAMGTVGVMVHVSSRNGSGPTTRRDRLTPRTSGHYTVTAIVSLAPRACLVGGPAGALSSAGRAPA